MNWDVIEGDWNAFKGVVKQKWDKLTDDTVELIAGKRDRLAGNIQQAYGITKDQAEHQIRAFEQAHRDFRVFRTMQPAYFAVSKDAPSAMPGWSNRR